MAEPAVPGAVTASIYDDLRSSILAQEIAPGSLVTESSVTTRFGVSRPTAKAAIERLVLEGILRREAHRAARVPLLTDDDIADLYDNRSLVECSAVGALARAGTVPAEALLAQHALVASEGGFARHDVAFHRALVAGQPSPRLARMHELLMGEIELCIGQVQAGNLLGTAAVAEQHQGILDAVSAGDVELAVTRTRDHIRTSRDALLAHAAQKDTP